MRRNYVFIRTIKNYKVMARSGHPPPLDDTTKQSVSTDE